MTMNQSLLNQLLIWLQEDSFSWFRNPTGPAEKFYDKVQRTCTPFSEGDLRQLLAKNPKFDSSAHHKYLYLRPLDVERGIVPVMSCSYDFSQDPAHLSLQVALFLPHDGKIAAIGVRFETSEGVGKHD